MPTYLNCLNQLKMVLNAKPNYSKIEIYGTKTIINNSIKNFFY